MKRFLLMAGVLVALLASCEKSEAEADRVPSTPEELLDFCQGNWIADYSLYISEDRIDYERGEKPALFFDEAGIHFAGTNEDETCLVPTGSVLPISANDGKKLVIEGISTAMGTATGVCQYAGKDRLVYEIFSKNIRGDGPFGGSYLRTFYVRTRLTVEK